MSKSTTSQIQVEGDTIRLENIELTHHDIATYLSEVGENERLDALEQALSVGVKTMQLADTTREEEFVERKFSEMRQDLQAEIERIEREVDDRFGEDGDVPRIFNEHLGDDGRLQRHIENAFGEEGTFAERLDEELGEDGERIQAALDPDNEGTPTYRLKQTLLDELRAIRETLTEEEAREDIKQQTTLKGDDFEATVQNILEDHVHGSNDQVEYTGDTHGELSGRKVGDFLLTLGETGQQIAIEAKSDQSYTQPKIKEELTDALTNRDAEYAIIVFECESYIPNKVGYFTEFDDQRLAIALSDTPEDDIEPGFLNIALNWARTRTIQAHVATGSNLDPETIQQELGEVEDSIGRFSTLRKKTTNIRNNANELDEAFSEIQDDITASLSTIRAELQQPTN